MAKASKKGAAKSSVSGPNMSRNKDLAGMSVKQGNHTVTYDKMGYAVSANRDGGASATHVVPTTHANDSPYHQDAYKAAQSGNWDRVGSIMNQYSEQYGKTDEPGVLNLKGANDYISELQNEFGYNATNYYNDQYDRAYGANSAATFDATGGAIKTYNDLVSVLGAEGAQQLIGGASSQAKSALTGADRYKGTNYHQDAIDAAQRGDWATVMQALSDRENKTNYTGENYGKTSSQIFQELWEQYGSNPQPTTPSTGGSFNYGVSQPTFNSSYDDRIDTLLNELLNRGDFNYNAVNDPLYQQYASMYNREGSRAMNDTLAAAAADAGGMNSYAITAAQQANNYYNAQLGDKIPQLYQLAYEMYLQDIDNQVRDIGLLQDMSNTQYNRYRDTMTDWYNDRDFAYGVYRDDVADGQWQLGFNHQVSQDAIDNAFRQGQFDWTVATDKRDYDYAVGQADKEWDYMVEQNELDNEWREKEWAYETSNNGSSGGSSSGGSSGGSSGSSSSSGSENAGSSSYAGNEGIDESIIRKMQAAVGATVDGKWGPDSTKRAGNKSASQAYKAYKAGTLKAVSSGDPYADTRNTTTSTTYKGSSTGVSAKAKQIAAGLDTMRGSIGSKDAIANTLAIEIDMAGDSLSDADARWLFSYFGYDPDEWLE